MTELTQPAREVIDVILEAIDEWREINPEESIKLSVTDALNANKDRIMANLLGFKETYPGGPWEIDQGSMLPNQDSPACQYITSQATYAIEQFFNSCPMPYMDWNMEEALRKEYEQEYKLEFQKVMRDRLTNSITADVEAVLQNIKKSPEQIMEMRETLTNLINSGDDNGD